MNKKIPKPAEISMSNHDGVHFCGIVSADIYDNACTTLCCIQNENSKLKMQLDYNC